MQNQHIAIRRGADVVGPDGPLGTVAHVVVDEATHEVRDLVIRRADGREWELPAAEITAATEHVVTLRSAWTDLRSSAREYAADEYASLRITETAHSRSAPHGSSLELREEEPRVRKQTRERGTVELGKEVVAERQVVDISVGHEELILERRPLDPPQPIEEAISEQEPLRVLMREELATVDKQPVVTEIVEVERRSVQETQQIQT